MNNEMVLHASCVVQGEQVKITRLDGFKRVATIFSFQKYASGTQKQNQTKFLGMRSTAGTKFKKIIEQDSYIF